MTLKADPAAVKKYGNVDKTKPPGFASGKDADSKYRCSKCRFYGGPDDGKGQCVRFNYPVKASDTCEAFEMRKTNESLTEAIKVLGIKFKKVGKDNLFVATRVTQTKDATLVLRRLMLGPNKPKVLTATQSGGTVVVQFRANVSAEDALAMLKGAAEKLQETTSTQHDEDIMNENEIDFDALTEDEAVALLDEFLIDDLEATVLEAVGTDANQFIAKLEEMQELLSEGEYEMAWDVAMLILAETDIDEERLDELKRGFKFSASARAKTARFKKKAKTGQARIKLKKARKMARKPAEKMKRLRFRKKNKARITRRRKQLKNSLELDTQVVSEMVTAGFTHAVVIEGDPDPVYTRDEETAVELSDETGGEVVLLTEYGGGYGPATKQAMAGAIAKFLRSHPDVGYGELATRFKIGRDVAQQVMLSVGKFTSAYAGGSYSTGDLAKHIFGRLPQVGAEPSPGAGGRVTAGDDAAFILSEDDRASIEQTLATLRKAGLMVEADLMAANIPGLDEDADEEDEETEEEVEVEETEEESDEETEESEADDEEIEEDDDIEDEDEDDEVEEDDEDEDDEEDEPEVIEAKKKKKGSYSEEADGQRGPKPRYKGQTGAIKDVVQHEDEDEDEDDDELVEVSAPRELAEELIEAAQEAGLDSATTNITVRNGRIYMSVPEEAAAIINQRLSA